MTETLYSAVSLFLDIINIFFIIYLIGYSTFLFLSVVVGAERLYRKRKERVLKNAFLDDYYIPVTIVVPAYNEEVTVVETVKSLLALEYRLYEIIVVDDGSKDNTALALIAAFNMKEVDRPIRNQVPSKPVKKVFEAFGEKVPVTLICKENGGKSDALNVGINASNFPYYVCMMLTPCCSMIH